MPIVSKDEGALQDQPGLHHPVDGHHHLPLPAAGCGQPPPPAPPASPRWAASRPTTTTTTSSMVNVTPRPSLGRSRSSYFTPRFVKNTGSLVFLSLRVLNKKTTKGFRKVMSRINQPRLVLSVSCEFSCEFTKFATKNL